MPEELFARREVVQRGYESMILASLVNIQKRRRVDRMPEGTMRHREWASCQKLIKCQDQVK